MFDAFRVDVRDRLADAERHEELEDDFVPLAGDFGKAAAFVGQFDGSVGFGGDPTTFLEAADGSVDGDVTDAEMLGEVGNAALPFARTKSSMAST